MNTIIALLITLVIGFFTWCLIILNGSKEEVWKVIYKKLKRR